MKQKKKTQPNQITTNNNMAMLKLNTPVRDSVTGLKGRLTHMMVSLGGNTGYLFQPTALNVETGHPVEAIYVTLQRIEKGVLDVDFEIPFEILGTKVEDEASGFKGTVTSLIIHTNKCVHAAVQAPGTNPKTGAAYDPVDFDIRRLKGKAIPVLDEEELKESEKERPSPIQMPKGLRNY